MRSSRGDGAKINRLFTLLGIVIMSLVITLYVNYIHPAYAPLKKVKNSGLDCQQEVVCFDKVFAPDTITKGVELFHKGNYTLVGEIEYAKHMASSLKKIDIDVDQVDAFFQSAIQTKINKKAQQIVRVEYSIVENDKLHPHKKNTRSNHCKLYAGYVLANFSLSGKQLFRIQIDFMEYNKSEIKERIKCIIKAFKHHGISTK